MKGLFLAFIVSLSTAIVRADEGMWLPFLLNRNYEDMKKYGLNLTAEEIYSINQASIKDAIISFNGYCTGEIISSNSLVLTNHHCGYEAIAEVSTSEHNYLDNGFWAKNHSQEIQTNLFATFVIRIEDVSKEILKHLNPSMTEDEREEKIQEISQKIADEATNGTHYKAYVRSFYAGNEFYLFITERFNDIRLVGTPPQSAGKYGGDTDNWMWPRHTADFSLFRIYAAKDGTPAQYSSENVPLTARHHLPISLKGVKENDFAMVLGFPGSTQRYLSSYGIQQTVTLEKPKHIQLRGIKMEVLKKHMDKDVNVRLKYASTYAQVANYWKNFQGEILQVKNNNVIAKKRELEDQFSTFSTKNTEYKDVLNTIETSYKTLERTTIPKVYMIEFVYTVDVSVIAYRYKIYKDALTQGNTEQASRILAFTNSVAESYFENTSIELESEIIEKLLELYVQDIPKELQGKYIQKLSVKKDRDKFMSNIRSKSIFFNKDKFDKFVSNPSVAFLNKDPFFLFIEDVVNSYEKLSDEPEIVQATDNMSRAVRLFIKGVREMNPQKLWYPDANSTMRLTYGRILPYSPQDAVYYDYVTSLDGMFAKEDPDNEEFHIDDKIKETWKKQDWGQYADPQRGYVVCNFLSDNDITGGNSGSPVINADGHLIGTAFDGNWEAMSGDIFFEDKVQRSISCDIRYILWIIDRVYGVQNIIDEMTIVR